MNPRTVINLAKGLMGTNSENTIELPTPLGWYDRLINGINRLGRPVLLVSAMAFFSWSIYDPNYFATVMKALATAPEYIQQIILLVVAIFGTGRIINDVKKKNTIKQSVKNSDTLINKTTVSKSSNNFKRTDNLNNDDPELIMNSSSENQAIKEWKKNATK